MCLGVLAEAPTGLSANDVTIIANDRAAARYTDAEKADVARIPDAATLGRIAKAPRELQAGVAGGDAAGVDRIVLPADFATFHDLSLAIWENNGDEITSHDVRTSVLAAQRADSVLTFMGNPEATAAIRLTWTPATRTLVAVTGRNISAIRFIYAELHD